MKKNKALFLDRDGVINHDYGYVHKIDNFDFIEGIFDLVREAKQKDYLVIIATNQAGIGRGYYSEEDFIFLMDWVRDKFLLNKGYIDDVYFCPYHPIHGKGLYRKDSNLRKPKPGMFQKAARNHEIILSDSILIGDKTSDIEAGLAAGIKSNILFSQDEKIDKNKFLTINRIIGAARYL
jgi:D-glycero-D-manno-heptose 1,7-bisphosphate phosphatase